MTTDDTAATPPKLGQATIYDVARAAGVATSTVSRAFSRPGRINSETVARVLSVADKVGYRPNRLARSLSTGRTGNLGMVAPNVANPFFAEYLRAFQHRAAQDDYSVMFIDTHEDESLEVTSVEKLLTQVDGIVLCAPRSPDDELLELIADDHFLVVNHQLAGVHSLVIDSQQALTEAFDDLTELGHRRVIYASGPAHAVSDQIRREHCSFLADERGMDLVVSDPQLIDEEIAGVAVELCVENHATAIVAHSDLAAMRILSECQRVKLSVPSEVSVIGHDNIEFASVLAPALTTIDARIAYAGMLGADVLVKLIDASTDGTDGHSPDKPRELSVRAEYVRRRSTAPPPAG